MDLIYNPCIRHEKLEILIKCMQRVVDESPAAYKETAAMLLDLLCSKNKGTGVYPETFMAMSNRGGGKTYPFTKCLMWAAMKYDFKIGLLCRTKNQLGKYWNGVFGGVLDDIWNEWKCEEKVCSKLYSEVIMECEDERKSVGYVLPLNSAYGLKNHSSLIKDCDVLFMDEFQSPDGIPDEMDKYDTMHITIARGDDGGVDYGARYLPTILCSNSLSITNKYMAFFGLMSKIQSNTKLYRGEGISLLRFKNEVVAENQMRTAYYRSKMKTAQSASDIDNAWLNDNGACVGKPEGKSYYVATVIDGSVRYGVHYYYESGLYYVGRNIDSSCRSVYSTMAGSELNSPVIKTAYVFAQLRAAYSSGTCMFSDQALKECMSKIFLI